MALTYKQEFRADLDNDEIIKAITAHLRTEIPSMADADFSIAMKAVRATPSTKAGFAAVVRLASDVDSEVQEKGLDVAPETPVVEEVKEEVILSDTDEDADSVAEEPDMVDEDQPEPSDKKKLF